MKNGRINERNMGNWTLNGELKHNRNPQPLPELSIEQEKALEAAQTIDNMLQSYKGGYYSYLSFDLSNAMIAHWFEQEIITKGIKESKYGFKPKEICILNESRIDDLRLVRGLLVSLFKLDQHVEN